MPLGRTRRRPPSTGKLLHTQVPSQRFEPLPGRPGMGSLQPGAICPSFLPTFPLPAGIKFSTQILANGAGLASLPAAPTRSFLVLG